MGATLSTYTDKLYDEKIAPLDGGVVSTFYEEILDHLHNQLEEAYEQNQRNSILINTLKAKLAAASTKNKRNSQTSASAIPLTSQLTNLVSNSGSSKETPIDVKDMRRGYIIG
ncbi:hypothetical protein C1645_818948 [Glomus cerebriforme]|uniref:Uncharacterized protein n=1 Tax=Glomus cerebriforme TaxID=658196 RepID=A0A397T7E4_9GLOM|nr:hypothetical protein C1645_818948 [Glomus cerebriforme]